MKKITRKIKRRSLLFLLSLVPIQSLAFAVDFSSKLGKNRESLGNHNYEEEMVNRLLEGSMPEKYYDLMDKHHVKHPEDLYLNEFQSQRILLKREFINDLYASNETEDGIDKETSGAMSDFLWP